MAEIQNIDRDLKGDLVRKSIHILSGLLYIPLIYISGPFAFEVLVLLALIYVLVIVSLLILNRMHYRPVYELIRCWGRENENYIPLKPTFLLHIGIAISLLLFPISIVYASIAITAMGDGIATISGKKIGKHKLPYSKSKSVEGTITGSIAAFLGAALFVSFLQALVASAGSMLLESIIGRDLNTDSSIKKAFNLMKNDNLLLPVFSGFLMMLTG
ncbi:diacylglycerol/polyprenol kinase family protein [Methanohalophilus mahii]|uniref:Phosphatidate cytidylyltransferase n=1 Tax=Methanohalophilus mahii (strain ATCC 35705 / DSM 5219 / SLP) TaxID=547558 RepID=D5E6W0_METMS|nr:diacylglycerol/polyprenol kinase family protein [Methanohalophilus mahii]ADE36898.1 phosphatidate cytidylyltransferase [Methanohalophilus mahii DSM 5219]